MRLIYRYAVPEDVDACMELRGKTRENAISVEQLRARGITLDSWRRDVSEGVLHGYVCVTGDKIVGYCFGSRDTGEIVVLALLPEYEDKGVGKTLLQEMVQVLRRLGFERLFLGCSSDPQSRSYGFYRHLGWRSTGTLDSARDEVLELFPARQPRRRDARA
jgi:ribosomal protein S18 acetylase RimI-like enzyme